MPIQDRPDIQFISLSDNPDTIRFFGTLMPALLLIKASPRKFVQYQWQARRTPRQTIAHLIDTYTDDAARIDGRLVFVHRWRTSGFDPFAFARAKVFLRQATRLLKRAGFRARFLDPLSPGINLPKLAAAAGLGNLSPFGLLVHPDFGPRLILSALETDYPLDLDSRYRSGGCTDCFSCLEICPQEPLTDAVIDLGQCQRCAQCLEVCPTSA